jgi:uroporphyrinogen-III synthase
MNNQLKNKLFISTRPKGQSSELNQLLETAGAQTIELPLIEIRPINLTTQEKTFIEKLETFNWLIFTSPNGVRSFFEILKQKKISVLPLTLQIAVIGKKTEKVLSSFGYSPAFVNPGNTGGDFAEAFIQKIKNDTHQPRVLLALGNLARTVIQEELSQYAEYTRLNVYETAIPNSVDEKTVQYIMDNRYEMLIFTSPSAIQNFMKLFHNIPVENIRLACIGETTASEARKMGIQPLVVAEDASTQGIVDSIIHYYS